ncbi:hypothetical protein Q672_19895 [Marinobacter sp. EVN1]|jgi:hypothetical protein|uniref:hypothetical protein n=1 Tax=Marinobacter sp. EVN1 TaxID=1397532 RepID=UPI0003B80141|nr:hypothetical protein [Marinobacter sp. EVN1]ERS83758.1 hypothetical protein Q672_19895 [Marinobacter sp. EVN1]KXS53103.1 MAG: hypothetical protein AWU57_2515 [Marinobacter sp. T13-3]
MISKMERTLAKRVIELHDGKSFALLQEVSAPSSREESEGTITEHAYIASCESIQNELGELSKVEFIDCLWRAGSQLTLWKAKYSASEDEVFWAVGFDSATHKVKDVLVNW